MRWTDDQLIEELKKDSEAWNTAIREMAAIGPDDPYAGHSEQECAFVLMETILEGVDQGTDDVLRYTLRVGSILTFEEWYELNERIIEELKKCVS